MKTDPYISAADAILAALALAGRVDPGYLSTLDDPEARKRLAGRFVDRWLPQEARIATPRPSASVDLLPLLGDQHEREYRRQINEVRQAIADRRG